ncbi:HWE histidine kinase domain-containing protein [Aquibium microcysteis]|uniref:HWE histidine kinase domain-containing protein n=1 Tax=Aquibium microcysteis TaxID=675281 RepID=UPI00165D0BEA|nr:HWE histidine kinase domain-containing protein [Aquibium microcysteis]
MSPTDRLPSLLSHLPAFRATVERATPRDRVVAYAGSLAIVLAAIVARFAVDPYLPPGFPYLTFFPAVVLTGFFFGIYPALMNTAISALVAWYWFILPAESFALTSQSITALCFYFVVIGIDLGLLQLLLAAYAAQVRAHEELTRHLRMQQLVSTEVDHRLKNLLSTISGLVALSQRHAATPQQLGAQIRQRIQAMGSSVSLLRGSSHGGSADMRAVMQAATAPLGVTEGERLVLSGPDLELNDASIVPLSLILHELATNALKYGALSGDAGRIHISWRPMEAAGGERDAPPPKMIELVWREQDGPPVVSPSSQGFGSDLIRRMAGSFGGDANLTFAPDGLVVRIEMDARNVLATAASPGF